VLLVNNISLFINLLVLSGVLFVTLRTCWLVLHLHSDLLVCSVTARD